MKKVTDLKEVRQNSDSVEPIEIIQGKQSLKGRIVTWFKANAYGRLARSVICSVIAGLNLVLSNALFLTLAVGPVIAGLTISPLFLLACPFTPTLAYNLSLPFDDLYKRYTDYAHHHIHVVEEIQAKIS